MPEHLVERAEELAQAAAALSHVPRLGLDVEGDGLYRYRSRLCVIQLAGEGIETIIDPLAIDDLSSLAELIGGEGPGLVVHDVSFDVKMLDTRGLRLGPVFDTSVAARFLSEPSTGLAAMLEKHFSVSLDKEHQQADWGERPLSEERRDYLVADVKYLPALATALEEAAREADILEEIEEETLYAIDKALEPEVPKEPWIRIKGAKELGPMGRSVLKALADAREKEAEVRDVPPFRVAHNRALLEAVHRRPEKLRDLRRVRGLKRMGDDLLAAALASAYERGPLEPEPPPPAPPPEVRKERKAREKALGTWRKAQADARNVDVQVVLPGHCLRDLISLTELDVDGLRAVAGFGDKRVDLYAEPLLELLRRADTE